ncbi:MAG: hypothetical protein HZB86_04685 [Deltaproteobacteria bacterium]|nr:hypothetical protein [Deltaproteobacteria bacterium]
MVRGTEKIATVALIALLWVVAPSPAEAAGPVGAAGRDPGGAVRLDEVRITGSPEHPGILFFLPRTRFRLLPLRTERDDAGDMLRDDREKGAPAP